MFLYSVVNVYFSAEMLQIVLWILCVFFYLKMFTKNVKGRVPGALYFLRNSIQTVYILALKMNIYPYMYADWTTLISIPTFWYEGSQVFT